MSDPLIAAIQAQDCEDGKHIKIPQPDFTRLVEGVVALRSQVTALTQDRFLLAASVGLNIEAFLEEKRGLVLERFVTAIRDDRNAIKAQVTALTTELGEARKDNARLVKEAESLNRLMAQTRDRVWADADNIHQTLHAEKLGTIDKLTKDLAAARSGKETEA